MKNLITILCLCLSLNLVLGCIDGEEVELWGECYNIEETTSIEIGDVDLSDEIPSEISNLINLETLSLWRCGLTGEIPLEIGNLINLTSLIKEIVSLKSSSVSPGYPTIKSLENFILELIFFRCLMIDKYSSFVCLRFMDFKILFDPL